MTADFKYGGSAGDRKLKSVGLHKSEGEVNNDVDVGEIEIDGKVLGKSEIDTPSWTLKLLNKIDAFEMKLAPVAGKGAGVESTQVR